ncbi:MAG: hypothetical protein HYY63_06745 [Elusimicrobia bacterium]|nr:hypothetical protein [Elusimicrobiota bacterium]MBI3013305.1 hypothetical protein [Elusimicrobiota bacterium]MBI4217758.1 hypothetical protein [Elusimicrobiota bacterium]
MSQAETLQVEYEAIKKFCHGDKKLMLKVIEELGGFMRDYFQRRYPHKVTSDELCSAIEGITVAWKNRDR